MTSSENENPYQSPDTEQSVATRSEETVFRLTVLERVLLIVLAIIVAIPTFFTTCIGGGFALAAFDIGTKGYGLHENVYVFLSFVCLILAAWAGFAVARLLYRRKRRRASSGDNE